MTTFRNAAATALLALLLGACSLLPRLPSVTDTHTVYAWPLDRCPSIQQANAVERAGLFAPIASILAGDLISALVGVPAQALANAAEADKKGFTAAGTNARYYYRATLDAQNKLKVSIPGCYVVAYAQPGDAVSWCENKSFNTGAESSCTNGKSLIESLHAKDRLRNQTEPPTKPLAVPEFYAEIAFDSSGYDPIVRPRLVALFYPKSLLDPHSGRKRTVSIGLTLTSPAATDALKAAAIAITLPGVTPGEKIPLGVLVNAQTAWTSLPIIKLGDSVSITEPGGYLPVTISSQIHEVGDPSLFLAAFSKALTGSTGDISKAINSAILPAGQAAAEQQAQTNLAAFHSAHSAALKSNADYLTSCAKPPASDAEKQAAAALYYGVIANRQKANIAASSAGAPPPFDSAEPPKCF